jgi:hypothetical protein
VIEWLSLSTAHWRGLSEARQLTDIEAITVCPLPRLLEPSWWVVWICQHAGWAGVPVRIQWQVYAGGRLDS